ncbi:MAG: NAD(P)H-dependent glycerol-3-phosphate dehydrogenase [bacterium]
MVVKVGVLGGGSWGTTVASLVSRNAEVELWARSDETVGEINTSHTNRKYLPDATLPERLTGTTDLEKVADEKDALVVGVPTQTVRSVLENIKPYVPAGIPIISLSKGLELSTRLRVSQIIQDVLPDHPVAVLTGPNLAREIMAGSAAASVIAMEDQSRVVELQKLFTSGLFRVYTNHDVIGCELGGVLKNIVAIAAGMGDGLGAGDNTRAAVITRGLAEISRLGVAMGGEQATFAGLAGLGDLVATCTSSQSRNHTVGYELGKGRSIDEQYDVDMPIAREVYQVVNGISQAKNAYRGLVRIAAGTESQPG